MVEGFSNDWNGIIPMEIVQETETRKPTLIISHSMLYKMSCLLPKVKNWKMCQALVDLFTKTSSVTHVSGSRPFGIKMNVRRYLSSYEYIEYPENVQGRTWQYTHYVSHLPTSKKYPAVNNEISNILEKLCSMFSRYEAIY